MLFRSSQNGIEEPARRERISQIKGLQNRKPKDEYMPFIQDFVKSGNWSHVKDLHHTDLRTVAPDSALATKMKAAGVEPPAYVSDSELSQLLKQYESGLYSWKDGGAVAMAAGGAVDYEEKFNKMLAEHHGMAAGGEVNYEDKFNKLLRQHHGMAEGGEVNSYNSDPDMSDGGLFVPAPAFAEGGAVKSIWTVN